MKNILVSRTIGMCMNFFVNIIRSIVKEDSKVDEIVNSLPQILKESYDRQGHYFGKAEDVIKENEPNILELDPKEKQK